MAFVYMYCTNFRRIHQSNVSYLIFKYLYYDLPASPAITYLTIVRYRLLQFQQPVYYYRHPENGDLAAQTIFYENCQQLFINVQEIICACAQFIYLSIENYYFLQIFLWVFLAAKGHQHFHQIMFLILRYVSISRQRRIANKLL